MATLTPEAKQLLSRTIRELRTRLLRDLHDAAESRYRLSLSHDKAKLPEEPRKKRERLDAWLDERVRTTNPKDRKEAEIARARFRLQAEKEAAATLLNRLVLLRHLEALGLSRPAVVTGGWNSKGYKELRAFAPALTGDETEGYAALLELVFDELALDLPGLFGDVGLTRLFPVPPATLREMVEKLDDPALESAWTDDTTLGWVYQYWNDPEREALDAKIAAGGKIEPYEIASKTQMFTERYIVEWLLHNSLGLTWLCMCKKHGWIADAEAVLPALDARRADWRKKREAGEVSLDALMPIEGELEEHWKYFVPQPIPDDAVAKAPDSVRTLKLLDPACGSGHFLVIAFDLLTALYREEARHRGQTIADREIAESILENNLHGIDIDPRAVQIAAAAVVLKAKRLDRVARPVRVNLVAPVLRLGELPKDDRALVRVRRELKDEVGIPEELTERLIESLAGVDYLGSLLKVDAAIDDAIRAQERVDGRLGPASQGDLYSRQFAAQQSQIDWSTARVTLLERLGAFLARHASENDLGLRLDGEQLTAGVRFVRMAKEGAYDIVVGNPPYHGTGKLRDSSYFVSQYPAGKPDLFACFYLRGLELLRAGGACALITLSNWTTLSAYRDLRRVIRGHGLRVLAELGKAAFTTGGTLISTSCAVIQKGNAGTIAIALRPHAPDEVTRDDGQPARTEAAMRIQRGRYDFDPHCFAVIDGEPIVYWWSKELLAKYAGAPKLGDVSPGRAAQSTGSNVRFLRRPWEVLGACMPRTRAAAPHNLLEARWVPFVPGSEGFAWLEPLREVVNWRARGLEIKQLKSHQTRRDVFVLASEPFFFGAGIAFSMIGSKFIARAHRYRSVLGDKGSSLYPSDVPETVCQMNRREACATMESLNPSVSFQVGDVNRLPLFKVGDVSEVWKRIESSFGEHEAGRECSAEFRLPAQSAWAWTQAWAQLAVDRPDGAPLAPYQPVYEPPAPASLVSFAVGVVLGRFDPNGGGVLDVAPPSSLPAGIIFCSAASDTDSLAHAACAPLRTAWGEHGAAVGNGDDLRTWLRTAFFKHHKSVYENRPIYFPLSSAKKNFVAWVSIHRWTSGTLSTLLADHLNPERRRLEGELDDLRKARAAGERGIRARAERRFADVQKLLAELTDFIDKVVELAERGPPPTTPGETPREQDGRYEMDLDDGVMVNSAALWPLLEPQWRDPKRWWHELAEAKGRKDYDWAHVARRYFPKRVEKKCVDDPSLAVAHSCFWRLHPAKAYAWELRLQDEIRPNFTIDETGSDAARAKFLSEHPREAAEIAAGERKRRERKAAKADDESEAGPLFEGASDDGAELADE